MNYITFTLKQKGDLPMFSRVPESQRKEIARRLRQLREERKWTMRELADRADLHPSTIANFENGRRLPSIKTLNRMAGVFGVSVDFIVGEETGKAERDLAILAETGPLFFKGERLTEDERKKVAEYASFLISRRENSD